MDILRLPCTVARTREHPCAMESIRINTGLTVMGFTLESTHSELFSYSSLWSRDLQEGFFTSFVMKNLLRR